MYEDEDRTSAANKAEERIYGATAGGAGKPIPNVVSAQGTVQRGVLGNELARPTLRDRVQFELQHRYAVRDKAMADVKALEDVLQKLTPETEAILTSISLIDTLHRYNITF